MTSHQCYKPSRLLPTVPQSVSIILSHRDCLKGWNEVRFKKYLTEDKIDSYCPDCPDYIHIRQLLYAPFTRGYTEAYAHVNNRDYRDNRGTMGFFSSDFKINKPPATLTASLILGYCDWGAIIGTVRKSKRR